MIRIQVASDLHLQHWGPATFEPLLAELQTDADVLVLPGDVVDLRPRDLLWSAARLNDFAAIYPHVVYVPGNHEFYGTSIPAGLDALSEMKLLPNVHALKTGHVTEISGHRFLGSTMWQPRRGLGETISEKITDHSTIKNFGRDHYQEFRRFETFLNAELREGDIVVTHHAPSYGSIAPRWQGDPCNRWFVTPEVEPLIVARQPALWMHGHVHDRFDYHLGTTRIVCNPRGYPGEGAPFDPRRVLTVP